MDHGTPEESARAKAIVQVLGCVLEKLVAANNKLPDSGPLTKFHALHPPTISIRAYLDRILDFASCSTECFVLSLIYIDRLIQRNRIVLNSLNVHRIVITSILLAAKFFDDQYYNNSYYAKVGGVLCAEMNSLELEFLFLVNFSLHVSSRTYNEYYHELVAHSMRALRFNGCSCAVSPMRIQPQPDLSYATRGAFFDGGENADMLRQRPFVARSHIAGVPEPLGTGSSSRRPEVAMPGIMNREDEEHSREPGGSRGTVALGVNA